MIQKKTKKLTTVTLHCSFALLPYTPWRGVASKEDSSYGAKKYITREGAVISSRHDTSCGSARDSEEGQLNI